MSKSIVGDAIRSRPILHKINDKIVHLTKKAEMRKLDIMAKGHPMDFLVKAVDGCTSISAPERDFKVYKYEDFIAPKEVMDRMEDAVLYGLTLFEPSQEPTKCFGPFIKQFRLTKKAMRVWKLLEVCYNLLLRDIAHTQMTLCYLLSTGAKYKCFSKELHVKKAIRDLEELLQCSRYCFGILATKCGSVAGPLSIQLSPEAKPKDCWNGFDLPGQLSKLDNMKLAKLGKEVRYIVVVQEKFMFDALVANPTFDINCSIVITGEGVPEYTTRFFLNRLSMEFPQVPVFGVVDWSPVGIEVLCAYKYGITGSRIAKNRLACSSVEWLGLKYKQVEELQEWPKPMWMYSSLLQTLTQEDRISARLLRSSCGILSDVAKKSWI